MINIKRISIIALFLILVGIIGSLLTFRHNYQPVSVLEEKEINTIITSININTDNVGVEIFPTNDKTIKVKLSGSSSPDFKQTFSTNVEGETLSIKSKEQQLKLFTFDFLSTSLTLEVYVPEKMYESIQVHNENGRVQVKQLTANSMKIDSDNGRIQLEKLIVKNIKATTNNGRMELKNIKAVNVDLKSDNGGINFLGDASGKITGKTNNGKISLKTKSLDHPIQLDSDNGNIMIQTEKEPKNVRIDVYVDNGTVNIFDKYNGSVVIGKGDNLIKLTTNNGRITVMK